MFASRQAALVLLAIVLVSVHARGQSDLALNPCKFPPSIKVFVGTVTKIDNPPSHDARDSGGETHYHFHIDEKISEIGESEFETYASRNPQQAGYLFELGSQYVVFADERSNGRFYVLADNDTRPMIEALALLPQLRALRDGRQVASLFGILRSADEPDYSASGVLLGPPLARTRLQLISATHHFHTVTDVNGTYAFYNLPLGEYRVAVSLPPSTELLDNIDKRPLRPIELPPSACQENDITVLPTGRVRGRVLGADGKTFRFTPVELFGADQYTAAPEASSWQDFNQSQGFFEFLNLAPGDYVLVFNNANRLSPDFPYLRTFYPGTPDLNRAVRIHLGPGKRVLSADIHLTNPFPTRELTLRLAPVGGETLLSGLVLDIVPNDESIPPKPTEDTSGVITFSLLRNVKYTIRAHTFCSATSTTRTRWQTGDVEVDGADDSVSEITLTKIEQACPK